MPNNNQMLKLAATELLKIAEQLHVSDISSGNKQLLEKTYERWGNLGKYKTDIREIIDATYSRHTQDDSDSDEIKHIRNIVLHRVKKYLAGIFLYAKRLPMDIPDRHWTLGDVEYLAEYVLKRHEDLQDARGWSEWQG